MSSYFNHIVMPLALVTAVGCIDFEISDNKDPVNPLDGPPPCIEVNPGELQFSDVEVAAALPHRGCNYPTLATVIWKFVN